MGVMEEAGRRKEEEEALELNNKRRQGEPERRHQKLQVGLP